MKRFVSLLFVTALIPVSLPPPFEAAAPSQETGIISGWTEADGGPVPNATVRLRHIESGRVAATTTADCSGVFAFAGVPVSTYVVEVVSPGGAIVGTSAPISLAAGAMAASGVTVGVSAIAARGAGLAGACGGVWYKMNGLFDLASRPFTSGLGITVIAAAAASGVAAIVPTRDDTSASR
jgi:hypothetical protein